MGTRSLRDVCEAVPDLSGVAAVKGKSALLEKAANSSAFPSAFCSLVGPYENLGRRREPVSSCLKRQHCFGLRFVSTRISVLPDTRRTFIYTG